jgi:hypothetical protein
MFDFPCRNWKSTAKVKPLNGFKKQRRDIGFADDSGVTIFAGTPTGV